MKTFWLTKHLFEVPCVAVLFMDLDWDDPLWNEKRTECVAKMEYLRRSLQGKNTRLAFVVIQQNVSLPGDNVNYCLEAFDF